MERIILNLPSEWLEAIDAERGAVPRLEWIRERLRSCKSLKPYKLKQPPRRGKWERVKGKS